MKKIESFNFKEGDNIQGKYEILKYLGEGWEGEVYLIKELSTGIEKAAKFFFPHRNKHNRNKTRTQTTKTKNPISKKLLPKQMEPCFPSSSSNHHLPKTKISIPTKYLGRRNTLYVRSKNSIRNWLIWAF